MMPCREAARLISEQKDRELTIGEKIGLRIHLAMCALCRGYKKNLEIMSRIATRASDAIMSQLPWIEDDDDLVLSAACKERIKQEMKKANRRE